MGFDIQDSVALVTGANRGIGKVIVDSLIEHGAAKIYGAVRNVQSLTEAIERHGDKLVAVPLDLTKSETVNAAANIAHDVSLLVNNAGVLRTTNALSPSAIDDLKFEMEGNVYGLLRVAQAFAPVLKKNGGGAFVQLNSVVSMKSFPDFTTYCASKAAAYNVTQALRASLSEQGTQVVSVHPGPIATEMGDAAGLTEIAESPQLVADAILSALAKNRFHAFAGSMAQQVGDAYASFATNVVEAELSEG